MRNFLASLFLGKPLHWLMLAIIAGGFWYVGEQRLHVIQFNAFILAVLAIGVLCVAVVLYGSKPGERLTRDAIVPDETEQRLDDSGQAR